MGEERFTPLAAYFMERGFAARKRAFKSDDKEYYVKEIYDPEGWVHDRDTLRLVSSNHLWWWRRRWGSSRKKHI
jgi:hypothetical protein